MIEAQYTDAAEVLLPASLAGPVWVAAPHPDDESLGCGGLLAELSDLGTPTWALLLTDGGASHPASVDWPRERLAGQRLAEWHAGLDLLGVNGDRRLALNLPDGRLPFPQQEGGAAAVAAIRSALAQAVPATVLLPWRRDPHPDHRAAHALIFAALEEWPAVEWSTVRRLEYTVWLPERAESADLPLPKEATVWSADVGRQAARKEAAIRCHTSQLGGLIHDDPSGFVLQEQMIHRAVSGHEVLLEVSAAEGAAVSERSDGPEPESPAPASLSGRYFDEMYEAHQDPWNFETSPYEAGKYGRTLAALPNAKYVSALEVGCSIGVLTARLAPRCTHLLSLDLSERALDRARARCADLPQVQFERRQMPAEFPPGQFELLVLSEVLYYLSPADLQLLLGRSVGALLPGGHLIAVHWTPAVHDYPQTGDQVHGALLAAPGLKYLYGERHEQYRLDLFERA